jgi:hypothetical protein
MANEIKMTFAGDADQLVKEQKRVVKGQEDLAKSAKESGAGVEAASASTGDLTGRLSKLGNITSGATDALDAAGAGMQSFVDLQQAGAQRAAALARALNDMKQAQEDASQAVRDFNQAGIDNRQATIDLEQADLNAAKALQDYTTAVKEHGKGSIEARQAQIDLKQAGLDVTQATEDSAQAMRDASQATIDQEAAQLDLNDANREAHPPEMQKWADQIGLVTPLLTGLVSVVALATAANWSLNLSFLASPITWIILGLVALTAGIVYLATKTQFFQTVWAGVWAFLKGVGAWFAGPFANFFVSGFNTIKGWLSRAGGWFSGLGTGIKNTFSKVTGYITSPFKSAFNSVSRAWNNTVGRLHFSIPGWVPGLGGNSFSAPQLPTFHTGGVASGAMGQEFMAVLRAGETVNASGSGGGGGVSTLRVSGGGTTIERAMADVVAELIRRGALKLTVRNSKVESARV